MITLLGFLYFILACLCGYAYYTRWHIFALFTEEPKNRKYYILFELFFTLLSGLIFLDTFSLFVFLIFALHLSGVFVIIFVPHEFYKMAREIKSANEERYYYIISGPFYLLCFLILFSL